MIKRKLLGQHFLNSKSIAEFIVNESQISKTDIVFEIGTGRGILTPLLCKKAQRVISVDADERLIKKAKFEFSALHNLVLESGDGFKKKYDFTIFVSNLPYSRSKDAVEWLAQNSFSHGIIMVQKEFAEKLNKSVDSLKKWHTSGLLRAHKTISGSLFYTDKDEEFYYNGRKEDKDG